MLMGLAGSQGGLVTSAQGRQEGVSLQEQARLAREGYTVRVRHGVYRVGGLPMDEHEQLRAAWLSLDPARRPHERLRDAAGLAVVSHQSAARRLGLGDLDADLLEFTTGYRKQSRDPHLVLHRRPITPPWTVAGGLPVTTVLQTVQDLAAAGIDGGHLAGVVRDAITVHFTELDPLIAVLAGHAPRYGAPDGDGRLLLQVLLGQAGVPAVLLELAQLLQAGAGTARAA